VTSPNFNNGIEASVTTFAATAIVIADMVGVGIFTSLGFQVQTIHSGFTLILLWVVGGIVAPDDRKTELRHGHAVVIHEQQRRQLWLEAHFSGCSAFQSRSSFCSFSSGTKPCRALRSNPTRVTSATFGARAASSANRRTTSVGRSQPIAANARNEM
jgi:hypothetical protein